MGIVDLVKGPCPLRDGASPYLVFPALVLDEGLVVLLHVLLQLLISGGARIKNMAMLGLILRFHGSIISGINCKALQRWVKRRHNVFVQKKHLSLLYTVNTSKAFE